MTDHSETETGVMSDWDCYCGWEGDEDGAVEHYLATGHDPLGVALGRFLSEVTWDQDVIKETLRPIAAIEYGRLAREWDQISAKDALAIWKLARLLNGMAIRRPKGNDGTTIERAWRAEMEKTGGIETGQPYRDAIARVAELTGATIEEVEHVVWTADFGFTTCSDLKPLNGPWRREGLLARAEAAENRVAELRGALEEIASEPTSSGVVHVAIAEKALGADVLRLSATA